MVGSEGMLGLQVVLAVGSVPLQASVRGPGTAWRIATEPFNRELAGSRALRQSLNCYLQVTLLQFTLEARCVRFHQIRPTTGALAADDSRSYARRFLQRDPSTHRSSVGGAPGWDRKGGRNIAAQGHDPSMCVAS